MSKVSDVKKRNAACCIGERGRCRTGRGRAIAVGRRNKIRLTVAMAEGYHKYETCENFGIPTDVITYYIDHQDGFPTHFSTMICEWPFDTVIFLFSLHILLDVFVSHLPNIRRAAFVSTVSYSHPYESWKKDKTTPQMWVRVSSLFDVILAYISTHISQHKEKHDHEKNSISRRSNRTDHPI